MKQGDSRARVTQPHRQVDHTAFFLNDGPPAGEMDSMAVLPQDLLIRVRRARLHEQGAQARPQRLLGNAGRAV